MSFNIPANATVTISVSKGTEKLNKEVVYTPAISLQAATPDDTNIVKLTRDEYVGLYQKREAATAEAQSDQYFYFFPGFSNHVLNSAIYLRLHNWWHD